MKSMKTSRDTYVKKRFRDQEREIISLKCKGCESCKTTGSVPKLARRTERTKQTAPAKQKAPVIIIQTAKKVTTPAVAQPIKLTIKEVIEVEMEVDGSNEAGNYHTSLAVRETKEQPALYQDENMF